MATGDSRPPAPERSRSSEAACDACSRATDAQAADLLEVIEDRSDLRSTIVTSQRPVSLWHEHPGEATVADVTLDRLLHGAHRLELHGESLRRSEPAATAVAETPSDGR
jgi:DNA replication protein DnaC